MNTATIKVPENIDASKLPEEVIYKAFTIAVELRLKELKKELRKIDAKIKKYEKIYKMEYRDFEHHMDDSPKSHEDWIDWGFLIESRDVVVDELRNLGATA